MFAVFIADWETEHVFINDQETQELAIEDAVKRARASRIIPEIGKVCPIPEEMKAELWCPGYDFVLVTEGTTLDEVLDGGTDDGFFIIVEEYVLGDRVTYYKTRN